MNPGPSQYISETYFPMIVGELADAWGAGDYDIYTKGQLKAVFHDTGRYGRLHLKMYDFEVGENYGVASYDLWDDEGRVALKGEEIQTEPALAVRELARQV